MKKDPYLVLLGKQIHALRKARGYTQAYVAQEMNVDR